MSSLSNGARKYFPPSNILFFIFILGTCLLYWTLHVVADLVDKQKKKKNKNQQEWTIGFCFHGNANICRKRKGKKKVRQEPQPIGCVREFVYSLGYKEIRTERCACSTWTHTHVQIIRPVLWYPIPRAIVCRELPADRHTRSSAVWIPITSNVFSVFNFVSAMTAEADRVCQYR